MRTKVIGVPVIICLLGAASFWTPFAILFLASLPGEPILSTNAIALFTTLACFLILKRKTHSRFVGGWMFLGIHLIGPIFLSIATTHGGGAYEIGIGTLILLNLPPLFWWYASMCGALAILIVAPFLGLQMLIEARDAPLRKDNSG